MLNWTAQISNTVSRFVKIRHSSFRVCFLGWLRTFVQRFTKYEMRRFSIVPSSRKMYSGRELMSRDVSSGFKSAIYSKTITQWKQEHNSTDQSVNWKLPCTSGAPPTVRSDFRQKLVSSLKKKKNEYWLSQKDGRKPGGKAVFNKRILWSNLYAYVIFAIWRLHINPETDLFCRKS